MDLQRMSIPRSRRYLAGNGKCSFSSARVAGLAVVTLLFVAGCTQQPSHQQIQEQAAQTTVAVKQATKEAVADTKTAAAEAEADVNDIATGVKSGLKQNGAATKVNLNAAPQIQLAMLPGISMNKAAEIVNNRPYTDSHELVRRGILTAAQYQQIYTMVSTR